MSRFCLFLMQVPAAQLSPSHQAQTIGQLMAFGFCAEGTLCDAIWTPQPALCTQTVASPTS